MIACAELAISPSPRRIHIETDHSWCAQTWRALVRGDAWVAAVKAVAVACIRPGRHCGENPALEFIRQGFEEEKQ
jgi:hypothetical protein